MESPKPSRTIENRLSIDRIEIYSEQRVPHTSALPDDGGVRSDGDGIGRLGDVPGNDHDLWVVALDGCGEVFIAGNFGGFTTIATSGSIMAPVGQYLSARMSLYGQPDLPAVQSSKSSIRSVRDRSPLDDARLGSLRWDRRRNLGKGQEANWEQRRNLHNDFWFKTRELLN